MRKLLPKLYAIYSGDKLYLSPNHGYKVYPSRVTAQRALTCIKTRTAQFIKSLPKRDRMNSVARINAVENLSIREFKQNNR